MRLLQPAIPGSWRRSSERLYPRPNLPELSGCRKCPDSDHCRCMEHTPWSIILSCGSLERRYVRDVQAGTPWKQTCRSIAVRADSSSSLAGGRLSSCQPIHRACGEGCSTPYVYLCRRDKCDNCIVRCRFQALECPHLKSSECHPLFVKVWLYRADCCPVQE